MHLYIHIPFCSKACHYCDFHFSTNLKLKSDLINAICIEIQKNHNYLKNPQLETIYFGGGTPSLLNEEDLFKIFNTINRYFSIGPNCEISFEANPDDINIEKLKLWQKHGINRLSIGIQSFDKNHLVYLNRSHNSDQAYNSVLLSQDAGFDNISIDLIYAIPSNSHTIWYKDLELALKLNTCHISSYCLTIEPKTVFGNWLSKNIILPIEDDFASDQFDILTSTLNNSGFEQYEISNFAVSKKYSKHNTSYWKGEEYLGVGPSAHSYNLESRQYNIANNTQYIKAIKNNTLHFEKEELSIKNKFNDYILTRLRTKWGINLIELSQISGKIPEEISIVINSNLENNFLKLTNETDTIILTKEGKLFADKIASDLFWI